MAAICAAAPLALANQLPLPRLYSAAGRGIAAVSSAIETIRPLSITKRHGSAAPTANECIYHVKG